MGRTGIKLTEAVCGYVAYSRSYCNYARCTSTRCNVHLLVVYLKCSVEGLKDWIDVEYVLITVWQYYDTVSAHYPPY